MFYVSFYFMFLQSLNPNIEAPSSTLLHHLRDHVTEQTISQSISKLTQDEDSMTIHIDTQLEGMLPFRWQFHLQEALHEQVCGHV